jgi:hypothetical protein
MKVIRHDRERRQPHAVTALCFAQQGFDRAMVPTKHESIRLERDVVAASNGNRARKST